MAKGNECERRDQHHDDGGRHAMTELDHLVLLQEGEDPPTAQRPSVRAAALGPAAEPGVADADDPADHDQREGRDDGGVQEAAEAEEMIARFATRGVSHYGSGYRGAAFSAPAVRAPYGLGLGLRLRLRALG